MTNQQLIKYVYIFFVAAILAFGVWSVAGKAGVPGAAQNSNQNSNSNSNSNRNANENRSQNQNANQNTNSETKTATGDSTAASTMSKDHDFLMEVALNGLREVQLGRWATQKGASDAVKQFAQRMVDDHSKANAEVMALLTTKGMTPPTELDPKRRDQVMKITRLSGAAFDRAFAKQMASDHSKAVAAFEKESTGGADTDIKAFASKTLPTLQEHLQMAKALEGSGSGDRKSNGNGNSNSNKP